HPLLNIRQQLIYDHNGLFITQVENLINKVELFGLYFATLDVRQDSAVHEKLLSNLSAQKIINEKYDRVSDDEKVKILSTLTQYTAPIQ
ncbi:phosphoenolpyruvate carboxylase, partial [Klebsiella pneumoniae]|uniref:phosphoenolpyruvate carboxylase n=1 Tax=Klebsiella pneumoniae TaxID=573 RepID=UPI0038541ECC